jgi:hypothetical protein
VRTLCEFLAEELERLPGVTTVMVDVETSRVSH